VDMMKHIIKALLTVSIFISFLISAEVNTNIVNIATIEYTIDGIDKNQTTNKVSNKIVPTQAIIEFLKHDDSADTNILRPTKYKDSSGNFQNMPDAILSNGTKIKIPTNVKLSKTTSYLNKDLIVIRVTDLDQNLNANKIDTVTITITNPSTGDTEILILQESEPNSGVFIGYIQASPKDKNSGDGYNK